MKRIDLEGLLISIGVFITICGTVIMLVSFLCNDRVFLTFGNFILYCGVIIMVFAFVILIILDKIKGEKNET